ncbi:hypothetical protein D3C83_50870 [compost metagenome]
MRSFSWNPAVPSTVTSDDDGLKLLMLEGIMRSALVPYMTVTRSGSPAVTVITTGASSMSGRLPPALPE